MNPKLISTALWAASLAFLGYLMVIAVPLVAPKGTEETIRAIVDAGKEAIVAFLGFLGGIIGLFKSGVDSTEFRQVNGEASSPSSGEIDREKEIETLRSQLKKAVNSLEEQKQRGKKLSVTAINSYAYYSVISAAFSFSVCHLASAGFQGLLQRAYPPQELEGAWFFLVSFAQTEILLLGAIAIPFWHYSRFLQTTGQNSISLSTRNANRIGGLSLFAAGFLSLAQLSPEQISTLLTNQKLVTLPVLNIDYLTFLSVNRLLLFPMVGIGVCQFARSRYLKAITT